MGGLRCAQSTAKQYSRAALRSFSSAGSPQPSEDAQSSTTARGHRQGCRPCCGGRPSRAHLQGIVWKLAATLSRRMASSASRALAVSSLSHSEFLGSSTSAPVPQPSEFHRPEQAIRGCSPRHRRRCFRPRVRAVGCRARLQGRRPEVRWPRKGPLLKSPGLDVGSAPSRCAPSAVRRPPESAAAPEAAASENPGVQAYEFA